MKTETLELIEKHLEKARKKHPIFTLSLFETVSIAAEELGEFAQAINDYRNSDPVHKDYESILKIRQEAADLIAVLIRFLEGD